MASYKLLYTQTRQMLAKYQDELVPEFRKTIQELQEKSKWNSVADSLPAEDVRVLVRIASHQGAYTELDTDRRHHGRFVRWGGFVTHWMPLPEAPKGE